MQYMIRNHDGSVSFVEYLVCCDCNICTLTIP